MIHQATEATFRKGIVMTLEKVSAKLVNNDDDDELGLGIIGRGKGRDGHEAEQEEGNGVAK
jgi:hypothetical protein